MSVTEPGPTDTSAASPPQQRYASRGRRLVARILDGLLVGVPTAVVLVLLGVKAGSLVWVALSWLPPLVYLVLMLSRSGPHNGQTLGKQWLGVRVVETGGGDVTTGTALKRTLLGETLLGIVTFGIYSLLDALWCLWDGKRQTLHDKIGGTVVVPS